MRRPLSKRSAVLLAAIFMMCTQSQLVSAHVLQSDKGVSAVLHIPPDDAPVTGRDTRLEFEIKSDTDSASFIRKCDCKVLIRKDNQIAYEEKLKPGNTSSRGYVNSSFPVEGVYDISLTGSAVKPGETFTLSFAQRVTATSSQSSSQNTLAGAQVLLISASSIIILAIVAASRIKAGGRYALSRTKGGKI